MDSTDSSSPRDVARFHLKTLAKFLRTHWRPLLALAVGLLVPLFIFTKIADDVYDKEPFPLEEPLMLALHAHTSATLNHIAAFFSLLGSARGMTPLALILFFVLYRRRHRFGYFAVFTLGGLATINFLLKLFFDRPRPHLWKPFLPENDSSFPSGHSMFAAALAGTIIATLWNTRWRAPAIVLGALYVLGMMWSRVYIGVHYPTDVLGGALFSIAWVFGLTKVMHITRPAS
ncbi:phosphatase PAP2 family protein [Deinococcus yavapaiensis]|uniref:Undecaprenyl-diphosphatase n=1 Tax=Deinococcus yavapaiensis KR-236 TaxID=694435 RepID=A0A318S271_9DEIO|nr:phosphatase PAP2 family protein [Deinococcus yavapaiensis]PYE51927.1 undecaprenyl-diphosphatase [Deinococcus yavapaiensis KR-236]